VASACRAHRPCVMAQGSLRDAAMCVVEPGACDWSDVMGLRDVCRMLHEVVVLPRLRPEVCACVCACVHVCMCACVHVCMYACVHVCMCACMHVCMCRCVNV
jgi:hypothetical protein